MSSDEFMAESRDRAGRRYAAALRAGGFENGSEWARIVADAERKAQVRAEELNSSLAALDPARPATASLVGNRLEAVPWFMVPLSPEQVLGVEAMLALALVEMWKARMEVVRRRKVELELRSDLEQLLREAEVDSPGSQLVRRLRQRYPRERKDA